MVDDIVEAINENLLEYLHTPVKIMVTKDISKINYAGKTINDLKKGSVLNVWQWVADVLISMECAEYVSKPLTTTQLMQLEWREKNNPGDIQPVPKFFYVEWLREAAKGDKEASRRVADIMTMRMIKVVLVAAKRLDGEILKKMTPEEEVLYRKIYSIVERWIKSLSPKESG